MSLQRIAPAILSLAIAIPSLAQTAAVTPDDYARAEKFLGYGSAPVKYIKELMTEEGRSSKYDN